MTLFHTGPIEAKQVFSRRPPQAVVPSWSGGGSELLNGKLSRSSRFEDDRQNRKISAIDSFSQLTARAGLALGFFAQCIVLIWVLAGKQQGR